MIGDHRGIYKALNTLKAFAGYYMVYLHGMTWLGLVMPAIDFTGVHWGWRLFSIIRVSFATCLPAFAGFYLRSEVGPYFQGYRLRGGFWKLGFKFFGFAVLLEALRLYGLRFDATFIFNWHALHFIALAMIVTYLILAIDSRLLIPFTALLFLARALAPYFMAKAVTSDGLSALQTSIGSLLWAVAFGSLIVWVSYQLFWVKPKGDEEPRKAWKKVAFVLLSLLALSAAYFSREWIAGKPRAIASFVNLPYAVLFANPFDDNFWPFVVAFPVFIFGYALRSILFDLKYRRYFLWMNIAAILSFVHYFLFGYLEMEKNAGVHTTYTKWSFMTEVPATGAFSVFYLCLVGIYLWQKRRPTRYLDRFAYFSRSILILYLVHGLVLHFGLAITPANLLSELEKTLTGSLWFAEFFVDSCYLVSLFLTHRIASALELYGARMKTL